MFNIYRPQKEPKKVILIISFIVLLGIFGGIISDYFVVVALLFWIHYTLVLAYLQFKRGSKHKYKNLTDLFLNPRIRFFIFESLAIIGIIGILLYGSREAGVLSLVLWWLFAYNFYVRYALRKK